MARHQGDQNGFVLAKIPAFVLSIFPAVDGKASKWCFLAAMMDRRGGSAT